MKIGIVFDQTSTTEFLVMLEQKLADEQLLFSYVELRRENNERIIARITNVYKENPLLSKDQAGAAAGRNLSQLGFDFSRRFTYGWATCTVVGSLNGSRSLDMNRRVIVPNEEVFAPSETTLRQLFFSSQPSAIPLGEIETVGQGGNAVSVPVTLDADQMVTKHFCIFGMTGSGKTNTAAKVVEELMARGQRIVIFDPHDDYLGLENLTGLFSDVDSSGQRVPLLCTAPEYHDSVARVRTYIEENKTVDHALRHPEFRLDQWIGGRLLQASSIIHHNTPTRELVKRGGGSVNEGLLQALQTNNWLFNSITEPRVQSYTVLPEIRNYGDGFQDFTILLMSAMEGEAFTSAQWRWLSGAINQPGQGIAYLQNLYRAVSQAQINDDTKSVLQRRFNRLQSIYNEAINSGAVAIDLENFFQEVASVEQARAANVYRLSLSNLSGNLRKALVYAVVTYFFRKFKFGGYRARRTAQGDPNAFATVFVLEEARSLIPKSSGLQDDDTSGDLARRAMRELAYEGRKFSLGFGLVSQKPASVDQEVVSQSNTFILHQLKSPDDQQYVRTVTDSMSADELEMVKSLGTGRAIVAGVAVKSSVLIRVHSRYSEEGIPEPRPIANSLRIIDDLRTQLGIEMQ